jgi:hypothetical protein
MNTDNYFNNYIDICIYSNGSHYDVSKVIYEIIKNKFIYCGKNIWKYTTDSKNYIFDDKLYYIKNEITSNVINHFIIRSTFWDDKSIQENNINISNDYQMKSVTLLQIANKLKDTKYINCIIKELKQFFPTIIDD